MASFADISNEPNKTNKEECTKKKIKDYFDKTFFIENSKKYVKVYDKLSIIDNLDFDKLNSSDVKHLGKGGFNSVKEFQLSEKCSESGKPVAVRIRSLRHEKDYTIKDGNFELQLNILQSINNIIYLSNKELHPKLYEIKVVKKENTNEHYLIVVMEKYKSSLYNFIKEHRDNELRGSNGIENFPEDGCPTDDESTSPARNRKLIIQLIKKTEKLIEDVANEGYLCYDIKPGNLVVNYNFKDEKIDIKLIDVDADFCVKDLHEKWDVLNFHDTYNIFTRNKAYKYVMMMLLSRHLVRNRFNYFARYFWIFGQVLEFRHKDVIKILRKKWTKRGRIDEDDQNILNNLEKKSHNEIFIDTTVMVLKRVDHTWKIYDGVLSGVCKHYFNLNLEDVPNQIRFLENVKGIWTSFCLKNLCVQLNKQTNIVETFDTEDKEKERKNKQIEYIPTQDEKDKLQQNDDESKAQSKNEGIKSDEYIEEKERPDLDDLLKKIKHKKEKEMGVFPELPLVAPGKGGKKKRKTRKNKRKKRTQKKNKRKNKKSKRKTRK